VAALCYNQDFLSTHVRKDVALFQDAAALIASDALSDTVRQSTQTTQNGTAVDALRAERLDARQPAPMPQTPSPPSSDTEEFDLEQSSGNVTEDCTILSRDNQPLAHDTKLKLGCKVKMLAIVDS